MDRRRTVGAWSALPPRARVWRVMHATWAVAQLTALAYTWWSAIHRRRDRRLGASIGFLLAEGVGLVIGRGRCPMGDRQAAWGDPVPFFELVLPPRAAKAAVPVLFVITLGALAAVAWRRPRPSPPGSAPSR